MVSNIPTGTGEPVIIPYEGGVASGVVVLGAGRGLRCIQAGLTTYGVTATVKVIDGERTKPGSIILDAPFYEFCAADREASQIITEILKAGTFESSYPFRNTPASKVA